MSCRWKNQQESSLVQELHMQKKKSMAWFLKTACFVPILWGLFSEWWVTQNDFNSSYFAFSQEYTECYSKGPITHFTIEELTTYCKKERCSSNASSHREMSRNISLSCICLKSLVPKLKQDNKSRPGTNKLDLRIWWWDTVGAARRIKRTWELDVPVSNMCNKNWVMNLQQHE